jgi:hypothetical protein
VQNLQRARKRPDISTKSKPNPEETIDDGANSAGAGEGQACAISQAPSVTGAQEEDPTIGQSATDGQEKE